MKALSRGNGQQSEQGRIAWGGLPWRGGISNILGRSINVCWRPEIQFEDVR